LPFIVGVSPILSQYTVGIYSVTLFELLLLAGCIIVLLFSSYRYKSLRIQIKEILLSIPQSIFPLYIIFLASCFFIEGSQSDEYFRTIRLGSYYFFCLVISKKDCTCLQKFASFGAIFVSIFLIIQYVLFFSSGYFLPGHVDFLPLAREQILTFTETANSYAGHTDIPYWLRFRSVLGEPSQIGLYVGLVYYCLAVSGRSLISFKMVVLACGLVMSFSGVAFVIFLYTAMHIVFLNKKLNLKILYFFCAVLVVLFLIYKFPIIADLQKSIFDRLNAYLVVQRISVFGVGYSKDLHVSWSPSLWRVVNAFGLLGLSMLLVFFLSKMKFRIKNIFSFILIFLIGFASEVLVSYWIIIWYSLLFRNERVAVYCKHT
jgi:hypothetical protein